MAEAKSFAKPGPKQNIKLARMACANLAQSRKTINRQEVFKAQLDGVSEQLSEHLARINITNIFKEAGLLMRAMNELNGIKNGAKGLADIAAFQEAAGEGSILAEMMDDSIKGLTLEGLDDDAVNAQAEEFLAAAMTGRLSKAGTVPTNRLAGQSVPAAAMSAPAHDAGERRVAVAEGAGGGGIAAAPPPPRPPPSAPAAGGAGAGGGDVDDLTSRFDAI